MQGAACRSAREEWDTVQYGIGPRAVEMAQRFRLGATWGVLSRSLTSPRVRSVTIRSEIKIEALQASDYAATKLKLHPGPERHPLKKSVQIRVHPCPIPCDVLAFFAPLQFIFALRSLRLCGLL